MPADLDVFDAINGINRDGSPRPWAWVHVRARTILGYAAKKLPFSRGTTPATPSALDHLIGTAEQVATRYVASDGQVYDLHDFLRLMIEKYIAETSPTERAAYREAASKLRPWPANFPGKPGFE